MTHKPRQTTPRPILSSIAAQLFVANIKSSCDFYTNKLPDCGGFASRVAVSVMDDYGLPLNTETFARIFSDPFSQEENTDDRYVPPIATAKVGGLHHLYTRKAA